MHVIYTNNDTTCVVEYIHYYMPHPPYKQTFIHVLLAYSTEYAWTVFLIAIYVLLQDYLQLW